MGLIQGWLVARQVTFKILVSLRLNMNIILTFENSKNHNQILLTSLKIDTSPLRYFVVFQLFKILIDLRIPFHIHCLVMESGLSGPSHPSRAHCTPQVTFSSSDFVRV